MVAELGPAPRGNTATKQWTERGWATAGEIQELLVTDNPADRATAIAKAKMLLRARPTFLTGSKGDGVIRFIYGRKMFTEIIDLADHGILAHPAATNEVTILQRYKVQALTELGKLDEAVAAAKSYYNVARFDKTEDAMQLLIGTLIKAGPEQAKLAKPFKEEQAARLPVDTLNVKEPLPRTSVLESIKVDQTLYQSAIEKLTERDAVSLSGRGNLLLLADRTSEAQLAFDEAYRIAEPRGIVNAGNDVARAMRAVDGSINRARTWQDTPWPEGGLADPRMPEGVAAVPHKVDIKPLPHNIAEKVHASPELIDWLIKWEVNAAEKKLSTRQEILELEKLLAADGLNTDQALQLLKATQQIDDGAPNSRQRPYPPVSGAMACQAVASGIKEVRESPKRREITLGKIAPLVQRLWHGSDRDTVAVGNFYAALADGQDKGSPDSIRGRLGFAESLGLGGQNQDALQLLDQLEADVSGSELGLLAKIRYDRGVILAQGGREAESIAELERACRHPDFNKNQFARALLLRAKARLGDEQSVARELTPYLRDFSISRLEALALADSLKVDIIRAKQLSR